MTLNISPAKRKPPVVVDKKKAGTTWLVWAAALGLLGFLVFLFVVLSFRREPNFYTTTMALEKSVSEVAGDEFERRSLDFVNKTKRIGKWSATFSAEHVNGWLATDFLQKFPKSLPPTVADPRIDFQAEEISLALRWSWFGMGGVAVMRADVYCTSRVGEIAIQFKGARTGVLSLPIKNIGDAIAGGLSQNGFSTRWTDNGGDPVLTVVPPLSFRQYDRARISIKSIDVKESEVVITGETTIE